MKCLIGKMLQHQNIDLCRIQVAYQAKQSRSQSFLRSTPGCDPEAGTCTTCPSEPSIGTGSGARSAVMEGCLDLRPDQQHFIFFGSHEWTSILLCLSLTGLSSLVNCFRVRPKPSQMKHLSGAHPLESAPVLTQIYLDQGACTIKLFTAIICRFL